MDGESVCPLDGEAACAMARRHMRVVGADWGADVLESALLATSELVTNALIHGGDPATLVVGMSGGTIRVEVYDAGRAPTGWPVLDGSEPGSAGRACSDGELGLGGRGLHIVDVLSERWGLTKRSTGKVVWFEINLSPAAC